MTTWASPARAIHEAANLKPARPLDLIVWPETMFRYPLRSFDDDFQMPRRRRKMTKQEAIADTTNLLADIAQHCHAALLFGIDRDALARATGGSIITTAPNSSRPTEVCWRLTTRCTR